MATPTNPSAAPASSPVDVGRQSASAPNAMKSGVVQTRSSDRANVVVCSPATHAPKCAPRHAPLNPSLGHVLNHRARRSSDATLHSRTAPTARRRAVACILQLARSSGGMFVSCWKATPAVDTAKTAAHSCAHTHAGAPKTSASIADSVMARGPGDQRAPELMLRLTSIQLKKSDMTTQATALSSVTRR